MDDLTVTIPTDDGEITKPLSDIKLPEGYGIFEAGDNGGPKGYVARKSVQAEIDSATEGLAKPDDLLQDDAFVKRLATVRGWRLGDDLKPVAKIDEAVKAELESAWKQEHNAPLLKQLEEKDKRLQSLESGILERDIMRQMQDKGTEVDPRHLRSLIPGQTPTFVRDVAGLIKTDERTGKRYYEDEDGTRIYDDPVKGVLTMLQKRDVDHEYFVDSRQKGSNYESNGRASRAGTVSMDDFEQGKLSPEQLEKIAKGELKVDQR